MRRTDTSDVIMSLVAALCDAAAVFGGFILAVWMRYDSHWFQFSHERPPDAYILHAFGALIASGVFLIVFRAMGLYVRPQIGSFANKIPRIIRATAAGFLLTIVLAYAVKNEADFARGVIVMGFATVSFFILLERYILFRIEWNLARHSKATNRVLVLGTDDVAAHLKHNLSREPMLRSRITGFLRTDLSEPDPNIPTDLIKGTIEELPSFLKKNEIDQIIVTSPNVSQEKIMDIIILCEQNLINFNMVPDLFRIMTTSMDVQSLDDIPLLGVGQWPLDMFWNRFAKRAEDIFGAVIGLLISAPIIAIAAILIRQDSPGPIFYRQERCGQSGKRFTLYKLRTMGVDAEKDSGPVWARKDDPRRTRIGGLLRRLSIDELPQFWNVFLGHMSLVGPRPERPHFVEQFKEDINRYMWRHVSKPGLTGWAQVNGLRGNTSIAERVKYDLYYLENWSLAFDFKILVKTLFARKNAY